ncbi:hypothetical protein VPFG_00033 [Vibrio phage nt-1]|uniref:Uncharacterized protein n=1 Tax=Vibrio phage nt-1 TaxID=115992 RepID=R9TG24_9CAUD|nr:hypothetical protein VPFG_00033 [Vibrio phage nt-1]AGN30038.1 hypothetical protein VPFG_00033 [Vibrio phage nt-1]
MTTPIHTSLNLAVSIDDLSVAAADAAKSGYDDITTTVLNHTGESYIIVDKQTYEELKAAIEDASPISSIEGLSQECIDILAGAVDSTTTLCREHTNSRFFRIAWTVTTAGV